jgi:ribosomal protein S27AE
MSEGKYIPEKACPRCGSGKILGYGAAHLVCTECEAVFARYVLRVKYEPEPGEPIDDLNRPF